MVEVRNVIKNGKKTSVHVQFCLCENDSLIQKISFPASHFLSENGVNYRAALG